MPSTCIVLECRSVSVDSRTKNKKVRPKDLSFHRFPVRYPELLKKWLKAVNRKDQIDPKTTFVCSKHFMPDCFERDLQNELLGLPLRKRLKKEAVPTLFPNRAGGKDPSRVKGNKTRALQKNWEKERKRIVEELLKAVPPPPKPTPSFSEEAGVSVEASLVFEKLKRINSGPGVKEVGAGGENQEEQDCLEAAAGEPNYNELTRDDLLRIIDTMWGILSWWKNKRISVLEGRIQELESRLQEQEGAPGMKENDDEIQVIIPANQQDEKGKAKEKEEDLVLGDKVQEKYIAGIEESLIKFCKFNQAYLEILDERVSLVPRKGPSGPVPITVGCEPSSSATEPENPPKPVKKKYIWKCEKCEEIFPTQHTKRNHKKLMHPKGMKRGRNGKWKRLKAEELAAKIDKSKWKCEICKELFDTIEAKLIHKREFHDGKKWKCNQCDEKYKARKQLRIHAKEAHGDNSLHKWECSQCEDRFESRFQLKIHAKKEHAGVGANRWICDDCDETFPTLQAKHIHTREKHKIARGEVKNCPYCDKAIQGVTQYELHLRRHTGERPYRCDTCEYAAFSKTLLEEHCKNQHEETSNVCMYCGRFFKNRQSLKSHERIYHEDVAKYTCPICNKPVGNMKRHTEEVHQNVRRFLCHMCDKKYKKRSGLNYHLVKHHKLPKTNLSRYATARARSQTREVSESENERTTTPPPKDKEAGVDDVNPSESTSDVGEAATLPAEENGEKISKDEEEVVVRSSPRKKRKKV